MANEEQVVILKQGADTWNRWRLKYKDILPDLSNADLSGLRLSIAKLQGANLYKANLSGTDLSGVDFSDARACSANVVSSLYDFLA